MGIEWHTLHSKSLLGNPLGDPATRPLAVYVPSTYHDFDGVPIAPRYPLVLMLSSHGNSGLSLTNWRAWDDSIQQQMDRLIESGCPPFVMALPDTWTRLGGSPHLNSPAIGHYGDYLLEEVIPFVEAHYRTEPSQRIIMGRSSGGYGALYQAMMHPGFFAAVADHSGDAHFPYCYLPQMATLNANLAKFGGLEGYMAETLKMGSKPQAFFEIASALTFAAAFAPNPNAPYGFDLPIDEIGALREDVWERCMAFDPLTLVNDPDHQAALRGLKALFIDCGSFDEYSLQVGGRLLSRALVRHNVPHEYEEFPGGHRGTHFRYEVSLPKLLKAVRG
jgi:enterochelin esterase family protein